MFEIYDSDDDFVSGDERSEEAFKYFREHAHRVENFEDRPLRKGEAMVDSEYEGEGMNGFRDRFLTGMGGEGVGPDEEKIPPYDYGLEESHGVGRESRLDVNEQRPEAGDTISREQNQTEQVMEQKSEPKYIETEKLDGAE